MDNNIKVILRFRPLLDFELGSSEYIVEDNAITLNKERFTFDKVFDQSTTNEQLFDSSLRELIGQFLAGNNGTILTYGQTGSGKSFTMLGLIPLIARMIFSLKVNLTISYYEIYMESIKDLLDPVREVKLQGSVPLNVTLVNVNNVENLNKLLFAGNKNKKISTTLMNSESSRSHTVFTLNYNNASLFLVDLAGSEKIDKSGSINGQLLNEVKKINSSLLALGNVINALTDGKSTHIPYRDSKLTRILQNSLGGNSVTSLIVTLSPAKINESETLSTLRFGSRAKFIKNKTPSPKQLTTKEKLMNLEKINQKNQSYIEKLEMELKKGHIGDFEIGDRPSPLFAMNSPGSPLSARLVSDYGFNQNNGYFNVQRLASAASDKYADKYTSNTRFGLVSASPGVSNRLTSISLETNITLSNPKLTLAVSIEDLNSHGKQVTSYADFRTPQLKNGEFHIDSSSEIKSPFYDSYKTGEFQKPGSRVRSSSNDFQRSVSSPISSTFKSRVPVSSKSNEEIERRDRKIEELENVILNLKMENLRNAHTEESKLFTLENALDNLNDKLNEVELINDNLRKHLLISEKIIDTRDNKINKLKASLKEQQFLISKETLGFTHKLGDIQEKLDLLNKQKEEELTFKKTQNEQTDNTRTGNYDSGFSFNSGSIRSTSSKQNVERPKNRSFDKSNKSMMLDIDTSSIINSSQSTLYNTTNETTFDNDSFHKHSTTDNASVTEFLTDKRQRNVTQPLPALESSDTSGMFNDKANESLSAKGSGFSLKIIKPFKTNKGIRANSLAS